MRSFWLRALMGGTLTLAALLKLHVVMAPQGVAGSAPWLSNPLVVGAVFISEVAIAIGLFTRFRVIACWSVILLAVFGNVIYRLSQGAPGGCGCFGAIELSPVKHVLVSGALLVAAVSEIMIGVDRPVAASRRSRSPLAP